jgi:hypothetical protein
MMSVLFNPKSLEEAFVSFSSEDKANFLKLYRAACVETSCPKSDRLTQLILGAATNPSATPEVVQPALAILQTLALQGFAVNPFSGQAVAPTASATSLRIGYKFGIEGNPYIRAEDIYVGIYAPTDAKGKSLGKTYHLFAAPQLQGTRTFNKTSEYLGASSDGFKAKNPVSYHKDLETALAIGGSGIEGKRFIPALDIVNGSDPNKLNGEKTRPGANLFALKETGDFKGSYTLTGSVLAKYVLSSSPPPDYPSLVRFADLSDGHDVWLNKDYYRFSGRPCRVVEVNHLTL